MAISPGWTYRFLWLSAMAFLAAGCLGFPHRPSKEWRTINTDLYEVSIQNNGRTDLKTLAGGNIFDNAYAQVLYAGEEEAAALTVDPRMSTRQMFTNRLGHGQGMLLVKDECQWVINAFPTKPFLTVQMVYLNDTKKPVAISRLTPWCVGGLKEGAVVLGPDAAETCILENGRLFTDFNVFAHVSRGNARSQWNLAAFNPVSGRSLIAGFVTNERAYTEIQLARSEEAAPNAFDFFRADCIYDPPVVVPPEGQLASELLYLGILEQDPLVGLERFAKAMAVLHGVRDERPFLPHGWDSWSTWHVRDVNEQTLLRELDFLDQHLKRYGWTHFAIDAGWQQRVGDWEPDPGKFPKGMKAVADAIHERGMTAGLWTDPFTVDMDSELAREHPEWLTLPSEMGRAVMGEGTAILDVTVPEAYDHVRALYAKFGRQWGFDALVETDFVYHLLLAESYSDPEVTAIEVLHRGMAAIREGFGEEKFIMSVAPQPVSGAYAQGIRVGHDCAPIWRSDDLSAPWGCVESLTNAARKFYFSPHLYVPGQDCAFFGKEESRARWKVLDQPRLSFDQSVAWLTGAALTGGVVKIGEPFTSLGPRELDVLRLLLPTLERPARPLDLFQEESPQVWFLPIDGRAGEWSLLGLFNWDETADDVISFSFGAAGLLPRSYYTVFDFWEGRYLGTTRGRLDVEVDPASVRLLGLRRYEDRPMLIASDVHITQGALDHRELAWDPKTRRLRGRFRAIADTPYRLWIKTPEPYFFQQATIDGAPCDVRKDAQCAVLSFHNEAAGEREWIAQF